MPWFARLSSFRNILCQQVGQFQDKFWRKVIDDDTRRYRIEKEKNQLEKKKKNLEVQEFLKD